MTEPGIVRESKIQTSAAPNATATAFTSVMKFEAVEHLLVEKPLRGQSPRRPLSKTDDADDFAAIVAAKAEGSPRPYDELRRELCLRD